MSGHSGADAHVDLDQKNSDSVFFDEKYLPNIQGMQHKKDRPPGSKPHQTKSKRKRAMKQKKLFMELSRDGKYSDKKSTLSRDERRVKRQLFIMEANRKGSTGGRRPKSKASKRGLVVNPLFDLRGKKSAKSFLQSYWRTQTNREEPASPLKIESQEEPATDDLDLSDIEDIRVCCKKYLEDKKTARGRRESHTKRGAKAKNQVGAPKEERRHQLEKMAKGSKDYLKPEAKAGHLDAPDGEDMLEKRGFGDAFGKRVDLKENQQEKEEPGLLQIESVKVELPGRVQMGNVMKKALGSGMVCLDMTQHFKHFPLFPPIN